MLDLSQLLTAHPFPAALERIHRSFARQPDDQTCGAAAIRHGLLLGGLTIPTAILEAVLDIRGHQGTSPGALVACLTRLGFEPVTLHKPARQTTTDFLEEHSSEFAHGAFLLPCIHAGEHWVCVGAWQEGRVGLIDSFFGQTRSSVWPTLSPGLGFFSLSADEFDTLDWAHFITLVRPGRWRSQYEAWLLARAALLRLCLSPSTGPLSLIGAIRVGVHQYLDDDDYCYRGLDLHFASAAAVRIEAADPGGDAIGVETLGKGSEEVVVMRRLGGLVTGRTAPPELVVRASVLGAASLGEQSWAAGQPARPAAHAPLACP
jgi:hypothetical protein